MSAERQPVYDLSGLNAISSAALLASTRAAQEPSQDSYNAAWLHGYADALAEVARQLEPQRGLEAITHKKLRRKNTSHER